MTELATKRRMNPIAFGRALRGDLDWIVMKAIEKERERRYESASDFADDIRGHLEGDPVRAGPPSLAYKTRKYIAKNRTQVVAACAVFLALAVGLVVSLFLLSVVSQQAADNVVLADQKRLETYSEEAENLRAWPPERQADITEWGVP